MTNAVAIALIVLLAGAVAALAAALAARNAELRAARQLLADDERRIAAVKNEIAALFSSEAASALEERQRQFDRTIEERRVAIDALLAPVKDQLAALNTAVTAQRDLIAHVGTKADAIEVAANTLSTALRHPQVRGEWGERSLDNTIETAGMGPYCTDTKTLRGDDGRSGRPDKLIRIPRSGGKYVAVDAKAPGQHFLDAAAAPSEDIRRERLREHANAILAHVDELARRDYSQYADVLPGTVLFLPNEAMLFSALTVMPDLYERARAKGIVITTPMMFSLIMQAYAAGWQQEQQEENAARIAAAARELYRRLGLFVEHFATVGKHLGQAVDAYNRAVGSYQRRLLRQAQRFDELGAGDAGERAHVEGLEPRDVVVHLPEVRAVGAAPASDADEPDESGSALELPLP